MFSIYIFNDLIVATVGESMNWSDADDEIETDNCENVDNDIGSISQGLELMKQISMQSNRILMQIEEKEDETIS